MAFTPEEVEGFIRDSTGKLALAGTYVGAIKIGKSAVVGLPQDDERFQEPISPKRVQELNTTIHDLFLEVSNTLAKVASAIDDGIQPAVAADVAVDVVELKG